jgi:hypothetical protein
MMLLVIGALLSPMYPVQVCIGSFSTFRTHAEMVWSSSTTGTVERNQAIR